MNFKTIALASLIALSPMMAQANSNELPQPIVELMPQVKKLIDSKQIELNAEQQAAIGAWQANAPETRKKLEAEYLEARSALRNAILSNQERVKREKLTSDLLAKEEELIKFRSLCNRMLAKELTAEQYDMVKQAYLNSLN